MLGSDSMKCLQLLKDIIIEFPKYGVLNAHSSLLPKYRGTNPSYWVIRNQEKVGGVTIHYIDKGMDTGSILEQQNFEIPVEYSYSQYDKKIAEVAGKCYVKVLDDLCNDRLQPREQKAESGFVANRIMDEDYKLDFAQMSSTEVYHYMYGTNAIQHIYKSLLFDYDILPPRDKALGNYDIVCKDGVIPVVRKVMGKSI